MSDLSASSPSGRIRPMADRTDSSRGERAVSGILPRTIYYADADRACRPVRRARKLDAKISRRRRRMIKIGPESFRGICFINAPRRSRSTFAPCCVGGSKGGRVPNFALQGGSSSPQLDAKDESLKAQNDVREPECTHGLKVAAKPHLFYQCARPPSQRYGVPGRSRSTFALRRHSEHGALSREQGASLSEGGTSHKVKR
jgi:hypothetical protein